MTVKRSKKRLYEIETLKRTQNGLAFIKDHSAFDSSGYYRLKDLEYMFNDIENYYYPILTKQSFDGNYQTYTCTGDKDNTMSINEYISVIDPYLLDLVVRKRMLDSNKIQLVIAIDLVNLSTRNIITLYVKSKNVICTPADNTNDISHDLVSSLLEYYNEKVLLCRTDSSYVLYSVNELSIHCHTLDLIKTDTYIPSPEWLDDKKATINPNNPNDNYCFAYAATIAIYHGEIRSHPERISSKLIEYTSKSDWNGIKVPADTTDYKNFEK